jgi:hypothetical protein
MKNKISKTKAKTQRRIKTVARTKTKTAKSRHTKKIIRRAPNNDKNKNRPRSANNQSHTSSAAAPSSLQMRSSIATSKKVVRIMGHGQFRIDARTLKRLDHIDSELVEMVASERTDDVKFKKRLAELNEITIKSGKAIERGEIVRTDIILPSADLPVDEAKKLFVGDGVIPEN